MPEVTRFAPSPSGLLHIGHAYSALFSARAAGPDGRFLLRIEDIDPARCKPEFEAAILEDLAWLGLSWEEPVRRQSDFMADYEDALARLANMGLIYPCFCTRKEILAEIARAGAAPHENAGPAYPGICRDLTPMERKERIEKGEPHAWRLHAARALDAAGPLHWSDRALGEQRVADGPVEDVVLARKDVRTSYHLSVTIDDAIQGITLVTRGKDLIDSTWVHRLLQALLELPVPDWHHHDLVTDAEGRRFAKRDKSLTIAALREAGKTPAEVRRMAGWRD